MKSILRASAFCLVLVGAAATTQSSATTRFVPSHQSAAAAFPIPQCGPGIPCDPDPDNPQGGNGQMFPLK